MLWRVLSLAIHKCGVAGFFA
ncbi:hypothetical protein OIU79_030772 [Salix purpurea]|uniref:Uncharacterized protein n=1 Tax=Salix purpurea TaxID=77065 RepID=A0A9Q0V9U1_SALPP|nr:hypothetical protein OIU79_030772 [Salix purpurea]